MKFANSVKVKVFSHEGETDSKILESFIELLPLNIEKNKIELKKTQATGFNEKKIKIYEITLTKESHTRQFIENFLEKLWKHKKEILLEQRESRLDQDLDFFIRIDKEKWIEGKEMLLTDSGNCFHIKIGIAAFPRKREIAMKIVEKMLE